MRLNIELLNKSNTNLKGIFEFKCWFLKNLSPVFKLMASTRPVIGRRYWGVNRIGKERHRATIYLKTHFSFELDFVPLCLQEHWYYNYSLYWLDTNLDNLVKLRLFLYNFLQMTITQYYCPGSLYRVLLGQKCYSLKNRLFYSMSEACCWLVAGKWWIQTCESPYYMRLQSNLGDHEAKNVINTS